MGVVLIYLQELEIAYDLSSEIIYEIAKVYHFPDYLITGYIDELEEFHFASDLQISRCKVSFRDQLLQRGRLCVFLGALRFLGSFREKARLLLLSKAVYGELRGTLYEEVLNREHSPQVNQVKMWWGCLRVNVGRGPTRLTAAVAL